MITMLTSLRLFSYLIMAFCLSMTSIIASAAKALPRDNVHLNFETVELRNLLKAMADIGGVNLMLSEKVNGYTSVRLNNVPWQEAFESILNNKGLGYLLQGEIIWVAPNEELASFEKNSRSNNSKQPNLALTHQVMIEARIVEADHRFARNLGIKLGAKKLLQQQRASQQDNSQATLDSPLSGEGVNGFPASNAAITMFSKGASEFVQLELTALEANGQGNIVANPRVVTADQVKALIEQGTELPYQTSSKEGSRVQFRKANLRLEVIPKIMPNRQVLMDVDISKDTVGMKTEQGYAIDTKHLRSQIVIEDGGTAVIGGVFMQTEREDIVQVPILGDIPLLGALFRHKAKIKDKTELLVFLTPTLIEQSGSTQGIK
jgi:type IV pilus assembly protein PilQ